MTQPAKVQEPSMEEILASIRRIIADDEAKPADLAVTASVGGGPAASDVPPRLHNVAPVAPHPATSTAPGREGSQSMLGAEKTAAPPSHDDADVFDLTDEMALPNTAPMFRKVDVKDDLEFAEDPPPLAGRREAPQAKRAAASAAAQIDAADILSKTTAASVESAFNSLATTVLSANSRTLEDLVKDMMRPMLKTWLDDNLPSLVERIVRAEIERVARGR